MLVAQQQQLQQLLLYLGKVRVGWQREKRKKWRQNAREVNNNGRKRLLALQEMGTANFATCKCRRHLKKAERQSKMKKNLPCSGRWVLLLLLLLLVLLLLFVNVAISGVLQ